MTLDPNGLDALVQAAKDRNVPLIDAKALVRAYLVAASPSPPALDGAGRDAVIEEIATRFDQEAEAALASVRKQALEALTAAHDFLDPISVVDSGVDVAIRALKETR